MESKVETKELISDTTAPPTEHVEETEETKESSVGDFDASHIDDYILPHEFPVWKDFRPFLERFASSKEVTDTKSFTNLFKQMHPLGLPQNLVTLLSVPVSKNLPLGINDPALLDFFPKILPFIASLALKVESIFLLEETSCTTEASSTADSTTTTTTSEESTTTKTSTCRPKILRKSEQSSNELTRLQVAVLLANMFFGTVQAQPIIGKPRASKKDQLLPSTFDFMNWITKIPDPARNKSNIMKLHCLLHYFWRVHALLAAEHLEQIEKDKVTTETKEDEEKKVDDIDSSKKSEVEVEERRSAFSTERIRFERVGFNLNKKELLQSIDRSEEYITECEVSDRTIESYEDFTSVHCDFANRFLGGGVLRTGCVQEEIMFAVAPELVCGMLFMEEQDISEAIQIQGAQRFCAFTGYAEKFEFAAPHFPKDPIDERTRIRRTVILAINATPFRGDLIQQYEPQAIKLEMMKCFVGFAGSQDISAIGAGFPDEKSCNSDANRKKGGSSAQMERVDTRIPIVTGNWGCGAYRGDPQLKFLIQLVAASLLRRKVIYCTFRNPALVGAQEIANKLQSFQVKQVQKFLHTYIDNAARKGKTLEPVFDALKRFGMKK